MKILFLMSSGFDRHTTSEHLLIAILEMLCKDGHSVHVIQKKTGGDLPVIPVPLSSYDITTDCVPFKSADKGNFIARYISGLTYLKNAKKYIKSGYDAVYIQSTTVAGFAVRTVRKTLPTALITFNVQDIFPYNAVFSGNIKKDSIIFKVLAAVQRYGYKHSDHIITISEDMKDTLVIDGVEDDKIEVVYNWSYQDELYENLDITPVSHMFDKNYFNVVYAGNIGVMQNVDILIEAARIMKNYEDVWFHIIGDGVYKEKLKAKTKEYDINNISFWPMLPSELAPAIYSSADVNIIPLVKDVYRTALPSKTATCLACKSPIIFAIGNKSKFGQMVMRETGCPVVESDNAKALAASILSVKNNTTKCSTEAFYNNYFKRSVNSKQYADIITNSIGR